MVKTKIIVLKLKKQYERYSTRHRGGQKWYQKSLSPPEYCGWLLKETEKSYCLLLVGTKKDKDGNIDIPERRIKMISKEERHCRRAISKKRYDVVKQIDGPSIYELLTVDSEYIRTLARKFIEGTL